MHNHGKRATRLATLRIKAAGAALLALGLGAGGGGLAYAAPDPASEAGPVDCTSPTTLNFLNFNDFHGRISDENPNTTQFFGTIEELRAEAGIDNTIVGIAGDSIGGTLFASAVQEDTPTIDVYNAAEIDSAGVGNHEFDRGYPDLRDRVIPAADFPFLGANVYQRGTTEPALEPYHVTEKGGLRVAVIGAVTADTPNVVVRDGIADLDFGDPVEAVNRVADQLTDGDESNGEADVIVAEYHEGGPDSAGSLEDNMSARAPFADIVENTSPKVQAIFTGHTQTDYIFDAPVPGSSDRSRPVTQAGDYAELVTQVELSVDPQTGATCEYTAQNVEVTDTPVDELVATYPRVAAVKDVVDQALADAEEVGQEPIGEATGALARPGAYSEEQQRYVDDRTGESTITNTIATMFADQLSKRTEQTVIGVQNPGGTRADLCAPSNEPNNPCLDEAFTITYAQAASVLPFANTLQTATLSGEQFKTMLEQQWSVDANGEPTGRFLRLGLSSDVTYTYDEERELGDRITSITIDAEPIDPNGEYVVGSGNFLLSGGDNFHVFNEVEPVDTGLVDMDAWVDWIRNNSPLQPEFLKRGLQVSPTPTELRIGESTTFAVDQLDFTGGYPVRNSELVAFIADIEIGRAAIVDGAVAALTVQPNAEVPLGDQTLVLYSADSQATASIPVRVGGGAPAPSEPTEPASPSDPASPSATPSEPAPSASATPTGKPTVPGPGGSKPPLADTGGTAVLPALAGLAALVGAWAALRRRRG